VDWMARRPVAIGIALGADRLVAALPAPRGAPGEGWVRPLGPESDVAAAFGELVDRVGPRAAILHVALLPPLAEVRHLVLPRLGDDVLRRVLRRDAARYFLTGAAPVVVGGDPLPGRRRGAGPVFAAAAPQAVVDAVVSAAEAVGWSVATIVPAESAWGAAACAIWRELTRGAGTVIVPGQGRTHVLQVRRGRLVGLRRTWGVDAATGHLVELVTQSPVAVLADDATRERIEAGLSGTGVRVLAAPATSDSISDPAIVAARYAARAVGPELLPDALLIARRRRVRRASAVLAACAATLLMGAAGLEYYGLGRELEAIAERRAAIRGGVEDALRVREVLTALDDRLSTLWALETTGPRWSEVLPILAAHLPRDAHLTALRAVGDSILLEGEASSAAAVFDALRAAPGIDGVRADAPIRRKAGAGGASVEQFVVALRLAPAPASVTASSGSATTRQVAFGAATSAGGAR